MTEHLRLGGLGLAEDFPTPPLPGGEQTTPTVPIPLESAFGAPTASGGDISIPVPLESGPSVPIPDLFF